MKFFPNIFNRSSISEDDLKRLFDEVEENNQIYKAILLTLSGGTNLAKDGSQKAYVKEGYEKNADVYSISNRIATMMSEVPVKVVDLDGNEVDNELQERLAQPNNYQIWKEFIRLYETFFLITGNGIMYAPTLTGGNDVGKLMSGLFMMPTQNTDIVAGSWRDPVAFYTMDISAASEKIPADQVLHIRMPNLQYADGANFFGMSPIKVAAAIIETENQGLNIMSNTLQRGIPPGILARKDTDKVGTEAQAELERTYTKKYGSQKRTGRAGVPIVTAGEFKWVKMGFDNFRDLQIIQTAEHGLRILCNVWGVPSVIFNDTKGSTFNNQAEARKAIYTNRIQPDFSMLLDTLNIQRVPAYGENIKIIADYSKIPELQTDKKTLSEWLNSGVANGSLTRNQWLEKMGFEESEVAGMDIPLVPFNLVPVSEVGGEPIDPELDAKMQKELKRLGIDDYKQLRIS